MAERDLLDLAKRRFKAAQDADALQREREHEDLKFQVPELQWDEQARRQRQGGDVGDGRVQPARPILSIPKIDQPIQTILNQERSNKLGINIHPLTADADDKTAAKLQGIYRSIERESQANLARSWGFDRAVKCGRGAYRITKAYDDDTPDPFDQVIRIERILYQEAVYFDPSATKPDFSDGDYAFVATWMKLDAFRRQFPRAETSGLSDGAFGELMRSEPNWVRGEGDQRALRVVEYWYKEHAPQKIYLLPDGRAISDAEIKEYGLQLPSEFKRQAVSRDMDVVTVRCAKLCGMEVLDEVEWDGKWIPIVPVIGKELQPFDEQRRWTGLIGPAKDAQRLYNYAASSAVELAALEPKAPWIIAEGQDEGYEDEWEQANVRNLPVLRYRPVTLGDQLAPEPKRVQVDVSRLGPSMQLLQQADQFLQATTQMYDPSLGRVGSRERSGRAILALQDQGEVGNSHFMHNLADIAMVYEARVILDLIPHVYDRPGRVAQVLDEEDEVSQVILNQPFFRDPDNGSLTPLPPLENGRSPMPPAAPDGTRPEVEHYDLSKGRYAVTVSVGKSYQSRLQAGAEEIGEILTARPELLPLIGPLYFRYRDFPGAREIADLLREVREKQFPGLEKKPGTLEALQAENAQLKQQNEQMSQQLREAVERVKTDAAKAAASIQKAQIDQETRLAVAGIDQETKLSVASIEARLKALEGVLERGNERQVASQKIAGDVAKETVKADLTYRGPAETPLGGEGDQV